MLPICRSTTARSGNESATSAMASGPERASRMVMSGVVAMAATSARTDGASLATRMVRTTTRLASPATVAHLGTRGCSVAGGGEQEVGDGGQTVEVVDVAVQERNPVDGRRRHLDHQVGEGLFLAVRGCRVAAEVLHQLVEGPPRTPLRTAGQGCQLLVLGKPRLHPVDDQGGDRPVSYTHLVGEMDGFVDGVGTGGGHQDEGGVRPGQQLPHADRPDTESLLHPFEGL